MKHAVRGNRHKQCGMCMRPQPYSKFPSSLAGDAQFDLSNHCFELFLLHALLLMFSFLVAIPRKNFGMLNTIMLLKGCSRQSSSNI
jgi:hypothetical protein